ncbi:NFACT family protein [Microcoleus sp. FACHB-1515]|uniref:Rqc2 family fibronectin-binding protein n=1 Tax=Cyanophyceae TaxID=3028117 RepID=UPI0016830792|nr:NFACT RNA binding domain-containing protein [Microcoleus sp. FACHB-1515]MBD2089679.1 NFACT family protein [Microcoleus sp. FACHB-1515]
MQPVDFTTLTAACAELRRDWLPARLEQVYQRDRFTLSLALRTLQKREWLTICWHPQAARIGIEDAPPRSPDTFTFSQQLRHQLSGLALVGIEFIAPWERALDLQFSRRPGDPALWHLYVEVMGKYSNVILTTADRQVVTVAHQVSAQQSSVRPIQTGQPYEFPPSLNDPIPSLAESIDRWRDRVGLIPAPLKRNLLRTYRGLSSALVLSMIEAAGLEGDRTTDTLSESEWKSLFDRWQEWLSAIEQQQFDPAWRESGYTVLGWGAVRPAKSVQQLLNDYYSEQLRQQEFVQLKQQLTQKLANLLKKLYVKAADFRSRLTQSDNAESFREQADLLMAYLHEWQPGMKSIDLPDFTTGEQITIPLNPEKNAVLNAQALYKRHQKLKRSRAAIDPLLAEVQTEIDYLEQVEDAVRQASETSQEDLQALQEIRSELIAQGYMEDPDQRLRETNESTDFRHYKTPSGFEVWVGRNNGQNDRLTRIASDYDLWFHTQEIPGSHVLLRLSAGDAPDETDLQYVANVAAYFSRARQSDRAPVVYTEPRNVYKPKGAKPGMVIYKQERILWGEPQQFNPAT